MGTQNIERRRWYGVRPGDTVTEKGLFKRTEGLTVVELHATDNNGCTVETAEGKRRKAICEWLTVTKRVEDSE